MCASYERSAKRHIYRRLQRKEVPLVRFLQSVVGRVRTAPGGVHHPRTVQGGERYPCMSHNRFGDRYIRLSDCGDPSPYEDEFVRFEVFRDKQHKTSEPSYPQSDSTPYDEIRGLVAMFNDGTNIRYEGSVRLSFRNKFFEHISGRCSLNNWVDIENEYYGKLKELLAENDAVIRNEKVRALNRDFNAVKKRLETYLAAVAQETQIEPFQSIQEAFDSIIDPNEVAYERQKEILASITRQMKRSEFSVRRLFRLRTYMKKFYSRLKGEPAWHFVLRQLKFDVYQKKYCTPTETLILNFNYTSTAERLYIEKQYEVINIHGQLNNERNPIIFGYGDELDDDYKRIEKLQDNDFLENIKSVRYHETGCYRQLLGFIESEPYQVITMGHSCGNSDRTLLNTLFEHRNCISVKVYYHQREDGTDDYSQLIRNLSRNFNDKAAMRDKVVNKEFLSTSRSYTEKSYAITTLKKIH